MIDLLQKVKLELYPVGNKIVLLIGTNDILQVGCTVRSILCLGGTYCGCRSGECGEYLV
jgi:hypothetical protein